MNYLGLPGQEKILKKRGNQFDTINFMKKVSYESAKNPFFSTLLINIIFTMTPKL